MLVLSRKQHELIHIGQDIVFKVIRTWRNTVKLGIVAPSDLRIARDVISDDDQSALMPTPRPPVG